MRVRLLQLGQRSKILRRFGADRAAAVLDGGERVEQVGEALGRNARHRVALGRAAGVVGTEDRRLCGRGMQGNGQGAGNQHGKDGHGLAEHGISRFEGAATLANGWSCGMVVAACRPVDRCDPRNRDRTMAA